MLVIRETVFFQKERKIPGAIESTKEQSKLRAPPSVLVFDSLNRGASI